MTKIDLEPSDEKMVSRWEMFTEFMLNRIPEDELKRMMLEVADGVSHTINDKGNIVEDGHTVIDREKADIHERFVEKVESDPVRIIREKRSDLKQKSSLPGALSEEEDRMAKISLLDELIEEIEDE